MSTKTTLTQSQQVAQQAAELLWACATSDDHAVAWSRSPVYLAAEQAFTTSAITAYGLDAEHAAEVRDLLSQYGPDDSLQGTDARGVASYVQAARQSVAERQAEAAERAAVADVPWTDEAAEHAWSVYRAGLAGFVFTAYLSDAQLGAFVRHLGQGWNVRLTSRELGSATDDEDAAEVYTGPVSFRPSNMITIPALAARNLAGTLADGHGAGFALGRLAVQTAADGTAVITLS